MLNRDKKYIEQRVIDSALYLIENHATVRETGKHIGVSKSTIHKDFKQRLPDINYSLYKKVNNILAINKKERHIRGGIATKETYQQLRRYK